MSKGLGKTQRTILECLSGSKVLPTFRIACTVYSCDDPTPAQTTAIRRSIHQLKLAGLVCCGEYKYNGWLSLYAWLPATPAPAATPYDRTDGREFEAIIIEALSTSSGIGLPVGAAYRRDLGRRARRMFVGLIGEKDAAAWQYTDHYNRALHRLSEAGIIQIETIYDSYSYRNRQIVILTQNRLSVAT